MGQPEDEREFAQRFSRVSTPLTPRVNQRPTALPCWRHLPRLSPCTSSPSYSVHTLRGKFAGSHTKHGVVQYPTSRTVQTYLLSLLLALLTVYAPAYALGVPSLKQDSGSLVRRMTWVRLFAELS